MMQKSSSSECAIGAVDIESVGGFRFFRCGATSFSFCISCLFCPFISFLVYECHIFSCSSAAFLPFLLDQCAFLIGNYRKTTNDVNATIGNENLAHVKRVTEIMCIIPTIHSIADDAYGLQFRTVHNLPLPPASPPSVRTKPCTFNTQLSSTQQSND